MTTVNFIYQKYGYKKYFIFDSDEWRDRIIIEENEPSKALKIFSELSNTKNIYIDCKVNIEKLFNMVLDEKRKILIY